MGVDIFGYCDASMTHVPGDDTHLDPRFPGGGGVLVAQAVRCEASQFPWPASSKQSEAVRSEISGVRFLVRGLSVYVLLRFYRPNPDNVQVRTLSIEKLTGKASYLRLFTILILCRLFRRKLFLASNSGIRSLAALIELYLLRVSHRTSRS